MRWAVLVALTLVVLVILWSHQQSNYTYDDLTANFDTLITGHEDIIKPAAIRMLYAHATRNSVDLLSNTNIVMTALNQTTYNTADAIFVCIDNQTTFDTSRTYRERIIIRMIAHYPMKFLLMASSFTSSLDMSNISNFSFDDSQIIDKPAADITTIIADACNTLRALINPINITIIQTTFSKYTTTEKPNGTPALNGLTPQVRWLIKFFARAMLIYAKWAVAIRLDTTLTSSAGATPTVGTGDYAISQMGGALFRVDSTAYILQTKAKFTITFNIAVSSFPTAAKLLFQHATDNPGFYINQDQTLSVKMGLNSLKTPVMNNNTHIVKIIVTETYFHLLLDGTIVAAATGSYTWSTIPDQWQWGSEAQATISNFVFSLDIGSFTENSPWTRRGCFTERDYDKLIPNDLQVPADSLSETNCQLAAISKGYNVIGLQKNKCYGATNVLYDQLGYLNNCPTLGDTLKSQVWTLNTTTNGVNPYTAPAQPWVAINNIDHFGDDITLSAVFNDAQAACATNPSCKVVRKKTDGSAWSGKSSTDNYYNSPTPNTTYAKPDLDGIYATFSHTDFNRGQDIIHIDTQDVDTCKNACNSQLGCEGFVINTDGAGSNKGCYLKGSPYDLAPAGVSTFSTSFFRKSQWNDGGTMSTSSKYLQTKIGPAGSMQECQSLAATKSAGFNIAAYDGTSCWAGTNVQYAPGTGGAKVATLNGYTSSITADELPRSIFVDARTNYTFTIDGTSGGGPALFTLQFEIQITSTSSEWRALLEHDRGGVGGNETRKPGIYITPTNPPQLQVCMNPATYTNQISYLTDNLTTSTWYIITVVVTNNTLKVYKNGTILGMVMLMATTGLFVWPMTATNWYLGGGNASGFSVRNMYFWNRELSSSDITTFNATLIPAAAAATNAAFAPAFAPAPAPAPAAARRALCRPLRGAPQQLEAHHLAAKGGLILHAAVLQCAAVVHGGLCQGAQL